MAFLACWCAKWGKASRAMRAWPTHRNRHHIISLQNESVRFASAESHEATPERCHAIFGVNDHCPFEESRGRLREPLPIRAVTALGKVHDTRGIRNHDTLLKPTGENLVTIQGVNGARPVKNAEELIASCHEPHSDNIEVL